MDFASNSRALRFSPHLSQDQFMMIETTEELLEEIITCGDTGLIEIRGRMGDDAVLVSQRKTYAIRIVDSSNNMLLVNTKPHSNENNESAPKRQKTDHQSSASVSIIEGAVSRHYELTEIPGRVHLLRELLYQNPFKGDEEDEQDDAANEHKLYDTQALRQVIQASDDELMTGLEDLNAIQVDGYWRIVDPDYLARAFEAVLNLAVEKDLDIGTLSVGACTAALSDLFSESVIRHSIKCHAIKQSNEVGPRFVKYNDDEGQDVFRLDHKKICLFRAMQLLAKRQSCPYSEFVREWQDSLPLGVMLDHTALDGICLIDEVVGNASDLKSQAESSSSPSIMVKQVRYFPLTGLSRDPRERFQQLFENKSRWNLAQITPYLQDFVCPSRTLDHLLLKFSRAIRDPATKELIYLRR